MTGSSGRSILDGIGRTPLVELTRIVPPGSARIVAKLESANPTGGMQDRVALAMVDAAVAAGKLAPGGCVVEYTGGTTGVSLALICAARGYRAHFVTSDAFSEEKRRTMRAYGAEVTEIASDGGRITRELIDAMRARAVRGRRWRRSSSIRGSATSVPTSSGAREAAPRWMSYVGTAAGGAARRAMGSRTTAVRRECGYAGGA